MKYSVLMDHDLLTKQQEQELATAVQLAQTTQAALDVLLEMKREALRDNMFITTNSEEDVDEDEDEEDDEEEEEENDYLYYVYSDQKDDDEDTAEALSRISSGVARMEDQERQSLLPAPWRDGDDNDSNTVEDELHMLLTDQDVAAFLNIAGGKTELHSILVDGALARETLIRSNVKLVVSIAKRWAQQAARGSGETARAIYAGGRDRPSLDEAIQEGILGLTTAADRFDPGRGLRFSTYATHWVTNSVRQCFQTSSVGMRVPMGYHDARSKFRTLVKNYYDVHGETPDFETLADEMNIKVQRLHLILKMTKPTLSLDGPMTNGAFTRAGQAGGSEAGEAPHIMDMLEDGDCRPEDRIELSFLRQSLENAMAQELAPHERDIVRLRLGLDDGVSMTTKQVAVACGGGLSISDVRIAEKRAFQKLRSPHALATYKFLAYLDFAGVDAATMKLR
jgi:RNA polymerase sigma factor (sigma-70 family)